MVDTFHPLHLTQDGIGIEDDAYVYSWIE
jgi:hypothetical protein